MIISINLLSREILQFKCVFILASCTPFQHIHGMSLCGHLTAGPLNCTLTMQRLYVEQSMLSDANYRKRLHSSRFFVWSFIRTRSPYSQSFIPASLKESFALRLDARRCSGLLLTKNTSSCDFLGATKSIKWSSPMHFPEIASPVCVRGHVCAFVFVCRSCACLGPLPAVCISVDKNIRKGSESSPCGFIIRWQWTQPHSLHDSLADTKQFFKTRVFKLFIFHLPVWNVLSN